MINCSQCNTQLVVDHVPAKRTYQCAACRCPNTVQISGETSVANRLADFGLMFGLIPVGLIVLGFILMRFFDAPWTTGMLGPVGVVVGIFGIVYGLKAILRSRYEPISPRSKWSAIIGATSGGCFGVLVGGAVALFLIASIFVWLNSYELKEPAKITEFMGGLASLKKPSGVEWTPAFARLTPNRSRIEFWDNEKFLQSEHRIYIGWVNTLFTTQFGSIDRNRNILRESVLEKIMGGNYKHVENANESKLKWEISGQTRVVTKTNWTGNKEGESLPLDYVTYECLFDANGNTFCIIFLGKLPELEVKESEVKETFESFQAK